MKVQLERRLASCPEQLRCVVCREPFPVKGIRALLVNDHQLVQGDICPDCLKLKPQNIQQQLRTFSQQLITQLETQTEPNPPESEPLMSLADALDLQAAAEENLKLPSPLVWWLKRLAILAAETEELEAARFGSKNCACCRSPKQMRIVFSEDGDFSQLD